MPSSYQPFFSLGPICLFQVSCPQGYVCILHTDDSLGFVLEAMVFVFILLQVSL